MLSLVISACTREREPFVKKGLAEGSYKTKDAEADYTHHTIIMALLELGNAVDDCYSLIIGHVEGRMVARCSDVGRGGGSVEKRPHNMPSQWCTGFDGRRCWDGHKTFLSVMET